VIAMLRRLFISLVAWSLAAVGPVSAALGADMAVVTGGEKGTYYQFGLNLQALGKLNGINLSVYPSKGSVENIYAVYQRPGVQVGIVQSDVLAFVAKVQTDQTLQRIAKMIKMVFPLYNEEVHLLARKGIASFDDLALVPITNKDIAEFYPRAVIPASTYAWQPQPVETVAVKAVLVSFDYRRADCEHVGRLAQMLSTNMEWLTKNGHPKWKTVNLEFPLKGWEQYDCVKKYLNKPTAKAASPQKSSEINPVMDAIREMLRE